MINNLLSLSIFCLLAFSQESRQECSKEDITYMGWKMHFPSTVGDAVKKHNSDYNPPGFYYKKLNKKNGEVILTYDYNLSDFNNEYQPRETLFPRVLNSYIFRFPEKPGLEDSLRIALQEEYGKKFIRKSGVDSTKSSMVEDYDFLFLKIDSCFTIGLTSSPAFHKRDRRIVVRFFYNLTEKECISKMGNYL